MLSLPARCLPCSYFLKKLNSCLFNPNFEEMNTFQATFEIVIMLLSLLPYFFVGSWFLYSLFKRTVRNTTISALLILNTLVSEAIKNVVRQNRPIGSCSNGYGFPSSHASFAVCLVVFLLIEEYLILRQTERVFFNLTNRVIMMRIMIPLCPLILFSRYYLIYHSLEQLVAGMVIGLLSGSLAGMIIKINIDKGENSLVNKISKRLMLQNEYELTEYEIVSQKSN